MITIGLIDDNDYEIDDIQATIYTAWQKSPEITDGVDFKRYKLDPLPDLKEKLEIELLRDIDTQEIQSLIVDYKLDSLRKVMEGKNVVEYLSDRVPSFPVIILTNAPQGSKHEFSIDPDKVYDKREFLQIGSSASDEMALKIYLNIKRYVKRRTELETILAAALDELSSRPGADIDIELISKISEIEDNLADYTTIDKTTAEKAFDLSELRELIADLSKLEESLDEP